VRDRSLGAPPNMAESSSTRSQLGALLRVLGSYPRPTKSIRMISMVVPMLEKQLTSRCSRSRSIGFVR
jgi:hypothetical protein